MNRPDRLDQAARLLADLHRPGPRPRSLPPELSPSGEQEAYLIQRRVARLLELEPGGWKVAMSTPDKGTTPASTSSMRSMRPTRPSKSS